MNLGHLNIAKPELERFSTSLDIQTRLYLQYSKLIEDSEIGKQLLADLESDERVKAMEGTMISKGSSASRFEPKVLAMWFLWAANEFGQEHAALKLNEYLDSHHIDVTNTLWVLGVNVDEPIQLTDSLSIVPLSQMPDSREKEEFSRIDTGMSGVQHPKPQAALTCVVRATKLLTPEPQEAAFGTREFEESCRLLYDVALYLNTIETMSCIPYLMTSYPLNDMPIGPFGGSGGGAPIHDIVGRKVTKFTLNKVERLNAVVSSISSCSSTEKARFDRVLSRLCQAKRRDRIEDKILDLGIALEMILLEDNKNNDQLSLSFRLRGAWFISDDAKDRRAVYSALRSIYEHRSQVAHSGVLCGNHPEKIQKVRESYGEYESIAERIIAKRILEGKPDWTRLILQS